MLYEQLKKSNIHDTVKNLPNYCSQIYDDLQFSFHYMGSFEEFAFTLIKNIK